MNKATKLMLALLVVFGLSATFASADTTLCTEDSSSGCVAIVYHGPGDITVASDGEAVFDPYGYGFDTSDGVYFGTLYTGAFTFVGQPGWVQVASGTYAGAWVLPADLTGVGCGAENEPNCEPLGIWTDYYGGNWLGYDANGNVIDYTGVYTILDPTGQVSDTITLSLNNGLPTLTLQSDPGPVPEPGTLALLGSGLIGLFGYAKRRLKK